MRLNDPSIAQFFLRYSLIVVHLIVEFYNVISQTIGQNFQGHPALYDEILGLELQEQLTCAETDLEQKITRSEKISKVNYREYID